MNAAHAKTPIVCDEMKRRLRAGSYLPGQRMDLAALASDFDTSLTPIRAAAHRLVGAGLLEDHHRDGFRVPLPTATELSDAHRSMKRLLIEACAAPASPTHPRGLPSGGVAVPAESEVPELTWQLFDEIAATQRDPARRWMIRHLNDYLAPLRHCELVLLTDPAAEWASQALYWREGDTRALQRAIRVYHKRRQQLAPRVSEHIQHQLREHSLTSGKS